MHPPWCGHKLKTKILDPPRIPGIEWEQWNTCNCKLQMSIKWQIDKSNMECLTNPFGKRPFYHATETQRTNEKNCMEAWMLRFHLQILSWGFPMSCTWCRDDAKQDDAQEGQQHWCLAASASGHWPCLFFFLRGTWYQWDRYVQRLSKIDNY